MSEDLLPFKLSPLAGKKLGKIRKSDQRLYRKINAAIDSIRTDPDVGEAKKGDLKGYSCLDVHHTGTNYEICYKVIEQDGDLILIVLLGPRENFYAELKRYLGF